MYILIALIVVFTGIALFWLRRQKIKSVETDNRKIEADCCGAHEVCETDSLLRADNEIEYYNDEELDNYKGKKATEFETAEIEEFREVLLTLKENEVAGWLRSLASREIEIPIAIRDEAFMIIADIRFKRNPA